ncbi:MAG: DUF2784 domain-containing protein [Mycobacterium sp.]
MRPLFVALTGLVAAAHFAFLIYLPAGGFLALRRRRSIWLHLAAVAWAIGSVAFGFWCPLTALERWARAHAGLAPLGSAGFIDHYIIDHYIIDHYITGRFHPAAAAGSVQALVLAAVLVSWAGYLLSARRGPARRGPTPVRSTFPE